MLPLSQRERTPTGSGHGGHPLHLGPRAPCSPACSCTNHPLPAEAQPGLLPMAITPAPLHPPLPNSDIFSLRDLSHRHKSMQLHILSPDPTSLVATALFLCSPFLAKLLEKVIYTYVLPPSLSLPFALELSGPSPSFLELATAALVRVRGDLHAAEPEVSSQVPFDMIHQQLRGFPGASGKEPACQYRRHRRRGSDRWIVKIPWRRAWQPTPVFLPEESHGRRSGLRSLGWHRAGHD